VRGVNKNFRNSVTLYSSDGISYLKPNQIDLNNQYLNVYKVMISKVTSEHAGEPDKNGQFRVLSKTEIRKPNEVCTDSYLVVGKCSTTFEVDALYKYMISKFFRFLLLQAVSSINLSKDKFGFIPLQDFTSKSDIDWTKSIEEIDNQLYDKYNLDEKEREFIEKMIKPM
jgi:hypothetical protein